MGERVMKGCGARRRVGAAGTGVGTGRRERGVTCADPSAAGGAARGCAACAVRRARPERREVMRVYGGAE